MRNQSNPMIAAAAVMAALCLAPLLTAQDGQRGAGAAPAGRGRAGRGPEAPTGPAPRLPNGKPDLSGLWNQPYVPDMTRTAGTAQLGMAQLPFTDRGKKEWETYNPKDGDYAGSCMPFGLTRSFNSPHPIQIMQNNDSIAFLFEQNTWFHWVPTNGRNVSKELPAAWFGYSTGKWDADTLIVETGNFNGWSKLDTVGHPHSDQLRVIQTFKRVDLGHIEHTMTIDDAAIYAQPWKNTRIWTLRPASDILMEYSCEENNLGLDDGTIVKWKPPVDSRGK